MESRQDQVRKRRHKTRQKAMRGMTVAGTLAALAIVAAFTIHGASMRGAQPSALSPRSASPSPVADALSPPESAQTVAGAASPTPEASAPEASPSPSAPPVAAAGEKADGGVVKLAFVGDVLLGSTVEKVLQQDGYDAPYRKVSELLQKPDLTVANLETPITNRGSEQSKEYTYRSSPAVLPAFQEAGFDLVNLANNHVLDYGEQGLLDTLDELDKVGIRHVGAGRDTQEAFEPVVIDSHGLKIAFLGFSKVVPDGSWKAGSNHPGVADTYNVNPPLEAIAAARQKADLVVVIAHWGDLPTDKPDNDQKMLAHKYVDAGADLVVASHPHVLQGFESYKGKWIAYSLGNFIFTTNDNKATWDTMILNAACSKAQGCALSAAPILTFGAKPEPMSEANGRKLLEHLGAISFHAKVRDDGQVVPMP